jgi:hypothetical protein
MKKTKLLFPKYAVITVRLDQERIYFGKGSFENKNVGFFVDIDIFNSGVAYYIPFKTLKDGLRKLIKSLKEEFYV